MLSSDPDSSWFRIANASPIMAARLAFSPSAILDDEALPLAGASQLRLDRQDDGIEIGPLARSSGLQRRGDLLPAQPDFDPIGRYGCPLDNFPDEAFPLDGRQLALARPKAPQVAGRALSAPAGE